MDILDEIDAAIQEKRSKWNYTPMREKDETDAIIDELLREFPSEGFEGENEYQPLPENKPVALKIKEQEQSYDENALKDLNDEQSEYRQYEDIEENAPEYDYYDINDDAFEDDPENIYTEADNSSEPDDSNEAEEYNDGDEYNEYISRKYTEAQYEEEEEAPEYNDDEYEYDDDGDDDDDDEFEEYEEEIPEESGKKKYTNRDFNNFMDSANDGEKYDLPKFSISAILATIMKIVLLAAFGALAVVGIINTAGVAMNKYNKNKAKPEADLKEKLQSVIYPMVVTETADFQSASELTAEQLINIAVWEVVINGDKSVFKDSDTGEYYLPEEQMAYIVEKLFGEDTKFRHIDSGINDEKIIYDPKNKQYVLPENTDLYTLHPVVTDVAQTDDTYTVYADCYKSYPSWSSVKSDDPVKRVMITMKKTEDYYNMTELKTIPLN